MDKDKVEKKEPLKITGLDDGMVDFRGRVLRHAKDAEQILLCATCAAKVGEAVGEAMTPRSLMVEVLCAPPVGEDGKQTTISEVKKARRYFLARRIFEHQGPEALELPIDVVATIKNLIGNRYGSIVVGEAKKWLDPMQADKLVASEIDEI